MSKTGEFLSIKLNELLEKRYNYYVNNEFIKGNKILWLLTFFIAIGEISTFARNYQEVPDRSTYFGFFVVGVGMVLLLMYLIHRIHKRYLDEAWNDTHEAGNKLIKSAERH